MWGGGSGEVSQRWGLGDGEASRRCLAGQSTRPCRVSYYYQLLSYLSFRVVKRQLLLHYGILGQISWHGFFFKKVE